MTDRPPLHPSRIDWAGDNHCLFLEAGPDGPWTALFTVFRVHVSPHGAGQGLIAVTDPEATGVSAANVCLSDNEPLFRWLAADFAAHYGAFKGREAFRAIRNAPLDAVTISRPRPASYREIHTGGGLEIQLDWTDLETPVFLQLDPARTSTKRHEVFGAYSTARAATAVVSGRSQPGGVFEKPFLGARTTTAYTIFSEVWLTASGD